MSAPTKETNAIYFRTDRFFNINNVGWYFNLRGGTVSGPYATKRIAKLALKGMSFKPDNHE